jgi:hypothetical protein
MFTISDDGVLTQNGGYVTGARQGCGNRLSLDSSDVPTRKADLQRNGRPRQDFFGAKSAKNGPFRTRSKTLPINCGRTAHANLSASHKH